MPTFIITRFRCPNVNLPPVPVRLACDTMQAERKRRDAAWLLFNREVDAMVRDHAGLDTESGVRAQREARAAEMPTVGGGALRIIHRGEHVMVEAV